MDQTLQQLKQDLAHAAYCKSMREKCYRTGEFFAGRMRRPLVDITREEARSYTEELRAQNRSAAWLITQLAALVFLFRKTLGKPDHVSFISYPRKYRPLPTNTRFVTSASTPRPKKGRRLEICSSSRPSTQASSIVRALLKQTTGRDPSHCARCGGRMTFEPPPPVRSLDVVSEASRNLALAVTGVRPEYQRSLESCRAGRDADSPAPSR